MMKKQNITSIVIIVILIGTIFFIFSNNRSNINKIKKLDNEKEPISPNNENQNNKEDANMKVIIKDKEYEIILENNETVSALMELLPLELDMSELNGNEKYYYLDKTLPINSKNPGKIEKGDVMLYGNNCLVIFYKSFNTSYSYTKIGHIDNLPNLGNHNIEIKFSK